MDMGIASKKQSFWILSLNDGLKDRRPNLLAETEGNIEAVLFGNLPIELPHCGHASVSAAGVRTASLDRLQVRSEVSRDIMLTDLSRQSPSPTCSLNLSRICPERCDRWSGGWKSPGPGGRSCALLKEEYNEKYCKPTLSARIWQLRPSAVLKSRLNISSFDMINDTVISHQSANEMTTRELDKFLSCWPEYLSKLSNQASPSISPPSLPTPHPPQTFQLQLWSRSCLFVCFYKCQNVRSYRVLCLPR